VPPSETPKMAARCEPTASITARMSSIRSCIVGALVAGSDMPVPRLSKTISRANDARRVRRWARFGSSQASSTWETNPGTSTRSIGASPSTWQAMLTWPLFAYLVSGRIPLNCNRAREPGQLAAARGRAVSSSAATARVAGRLRMPATQSQLYGELAHLAATGLVQASHPGPRGRKELTPAGYPHRPGTRPAQPDPAARLLPVDPASPGRPRLPGAGRHPQPRLPSATPRPPGIP
jgi:hypothetical protein